MGTSFWDPLLKGGVKIWQLSDRSLEDKTQQCVEQIKRARKKNNNSSLYVVILGVMYPAVGCGKSAIFCSFAAPGEVKVIAPEVPVTGQVTSAVEL